MLYRGRVELPIQDSRPRRRSGTVLLVVIAVAIAVTGAGCYAGITDQIQFDGSHWHLLEVGQTKMRTGPTFRFSMVPGSNGKGQVTITGCGAVVEADVTMSVDEREVSSSGQRMSFPTAAALAGEAGPTCAALFEALATVHRWQRLDATSILLDGDQDVRLEAELGS